MNKLCKVLLLSTITFFCSCTENHSLSNAKMAPNPLNIDAKVSIVTSKDAYASNEEFSLTLNVLDYENLQGVSVSFLPNTSMFEVLIEGRMTNSYVNADAFTHSSTEQGLYDYYSISKDKPKVYDYHNDNSLFVIKLKALEDIPSISSIFTITTDTTLLDFYSNIFVIKLSDSFAKSINYNLVYGNYINYSSQVPERINTSDATIDFMSFINVEALPNNIKCYVDTTQYEEDGKVGDSIINFVFFDLNTACRVSYGVPIKTTDITKPSITFESGNTIDVLIGTEFNDDVSIHDDFDNSPVLQIDSDLDMNKLGTYSIKYTVTDSSGNSSEATRTVNVFENGKLDEDQDLHCVGKKASFKVPILNNGSHSIKSFCLCFDLGSLENVSVDKGCDLIKDGNKFVVSGSFDIPVKPSEELFSFKVDLPSSSKLFDTFRISLISDLRNVVACEDNFIDGNYSLMYQKIKYGLFGDVNQDNEIDLLDALLLNEYLKGQFEINDEDVLTLCDVNLDLNIDINDVQMIREYLVHRIAKLGD